MSFVKFSFLILCLSSTGVLSDVSDAFIDAGISADTGTEPPQQLLQVTYGDIKVNPGDKLGDLQVTSEPVVAFGRLPSTYFSLFMIDPDAPVPGQFLHWMVTNINGPNVDSGNSVAPYFPPGAPTPHRYTFLVYEHDEKLNLKENEIVLSTAGRSVFDIEDFANTHNLGDPKLGNYFYGTAVPISI